MQCSAAKGNFTKSLASISDGDDVKYNSIRNSKLFAVCINFDDVVKDND
jgi:hypothetical protein